MALYESEHTKFMREFLEKNPEQREEQRKGRAMWWDRPQDELRTREVKAATVPQKPYYYQSET